MNACNDHVMKREMNVSRVPNGCANSFGGTTKRRDLNETSAKRRVNDSATRGPRQPWATHGRSFNLLNGPELSAGKVVVFSGPTIPGRTIKRMSKRCRDTFSQRLIWVRGF
ncbi:hypothetical protein TNCV_1068341 [Trichonephila clavipes]|nr:hypothetical protein TNCV_1068341 [Trichonephila clavipes]